MSKIYKHRFVVDCLTTNKQKIYLTKPALEMCQQGAVLHGCVIGLDPDNMASRQKFWVISKLKLEFLKPIKLNEKVEFLSYPLKPSGSFSMDREFLFKVKGENRIVGTSKWCVIDSNSNTLARFNTISDIMPKSYGSPIDYKIAYSRVNFDQTFTKHHTRKIMFNDLDINMHCNNQKYVEMALNCLDLNDFNKLQKSFEISYIKQCYFGDSIDVYKKVDNNIVYVFGIVKGEKVFSATMEFYN